MLVDHPREPQLAEELVVSHIVETFYILKPRGGTLCFHLHVLKTIEFTAIIIEIGEKLQPTRAIFQVGLLHAREIVSKTILRTKRSSKAFTLWQLGANTDN